MPISTITLSQVVDLAVTHVDLIPLTNVGGYTNEPALSLCNDVLAELLSTPNDWKFNRQEMPMLVTAPQKQDYLFAGACAFTLGSTSRGAAIDLVANSGITESGTTVTVKTLEAHGFSVGDTVYMQGNSVAAYNSTLTQTSSSSTWSGGWTILTVPTTTSFTFTHASSGLATSGASGITDYSWLCSGTVVEMNNTSSPQNIQLLEAVKELQPLSRVDNPSKVCVIKDYGTGVLKIRFQSVPGSTIWGANLVYQGSPPLKVALTDTWSPFPDHYAYVIRQAFIWAAYRYAGAPKADSEYEKLQQKVMKAMGQSDRETSDIHVFPEQALMDTNLFGW
jgi:hypothetical protein